MNTILVATDNSALANNALNYAAEMATLTNSKIVLVSAYQYIVSSAYDVSVSTFTSEDIRDALKSTHQKSIDEIKTIHHTLIIESIVEQGATDSVIIEAAALHNAHIIIMGLSGEGAVSKYILGNTTRNVIRANKFMVMAIPADYVYRGISRVVFAFDYEKYSKSKIESFIQFLKAYKSRLLIVNIVDSIADINSDKAVTGLLFERELYDIEHTYHYPADEHVAKAITDFCEERKAECLAIIPHHHSFLDKLFVSSTTDKILNHITIPLLAIPD